MPSARSYFNTALYRKHLTRYWPIWALYTLIWFFILPVYLILRANADYNSMSTTAERFADLSILQTLTGAGLFMPVVMGVLTAMAIWSYLYNNRAAGLIHALPIRREGLFFTGFLAGLTFFLIPNILIFLLTLGAEALAGAVNLGALALWFCGESMLCLFFFCFATLCAFVAGNILALPFFYFVFNGLVIGILALVENALHNFVYGFNGLTGIWDVAKGLTPLYCIYDVLKVSYQYENGVFGNIRLHGMPALAAYAAIGLALAALALHLYRRHQVEKAGEVVTAGRLRPVFKYGVAFCGALAFGTLLYEVFRDAFGYSAWGMLGFLLLCGFLSYLAAEMLLQKSFRVLGKSWKGCAVFLAVLVILTAAVEFDVTGYEKRVPDAAQVELVTVSNIGSMPYDSGRNSAIDAADAALIARVVSLHGSAVGNKEAVEAGLRGYSGAYKSAAVTGGVSVQTMNRVGFELTYTLKNGRILTRSYSIPVTAELLEDPASPGPAAGSPQPQGGSCPRLLPRHRFRRRFYRRYRLLLRCVCRRKL